MTPVTLRSARFATLDDGALWLLQDEARRPYLVDTALGRLYTLPAVEPLTPVLPYEDWMAEWSSAERFRLDLPTGTVALGKAAEFSAVDHRGDGVVVPTAALTTVARVALDLPDSLLVDHAPDLIADVASRRQAVVVIETLLGERVLLDLADQGSFCLVSYHRAGHPDAVASHPPRPSYVWSNPRPGCRFRWETENPSGRSRQHCTLGTVVAVRVVEGV